MATYERQRVTVVRRVCFRIRRQKHATRRT